MRSGNIKIAVASLRASKWRSLLTMLGIIIGVCSVVTVVSLGEGLKQQVVGEINRLGKDLILVRSGRVVTKDASGNISSVNPLAVLSTSTLTEADLTAIRKLPSVKTASPISLITNSVAHESTQINDAFVIASEHELPIVLNQSILYGGYFTTEEINGDYAVIGQNIAVNLYNELNPVGKTISIEGRDLIIRGVFEEFEGGAFTTAGTDYNSAVFIPYKTGQRITADKAQIQQIFIKSSEPELTEATVDDVQRTIRAEHQGQENFTVLKQDDLFQITSDVLGIFTGFISTIAGISLIVGGIGIMNIMLLSVTERTREIGIRKAVGATNKQILNQFLVEGMMLSIIGGVIGILIALIIGVLLRIATDFKPVITWPIVVIAVGVSIIVGVIFSIAPAFKAAKKDPIEALRSD